ncbi:hypothetical protein SK128_006889, partial [Halocaridina rubra]
KPKGRQNYVKLSVASEGKNSKKPPRGDPFGCREVSPMELKKGSDTVSFKFKKKWRLITLHRVTCSDFGDSPLKLEEVDMTPSVPWPKAKRNLAYESGTLEQPIRVPKRVIFRAS